MMGRSQPPSLGSVLLGCCLSVSALAAQPPASPRASDAPTAELRHQAVAVAEKSLVGVARLAVEPGQSDGAAPLFPRMPDGLGLLERDGALIPHEVAAGVVVGESRILTRYHLVGQVASSRYASSRYRYYVWIAGRPRPADLLAADPWFDVAVFRTQPDGLTPIRWGDGAVVRKGQTLFALGNPRGVFPDESPSVTWGVVEQLLARAPPITGAAADAPGRETIHHYGTLIRTTAALDPGFDGGALVDRRGAMVGLLTAWTAGVSSADAAGLAIPVDHALRRVVEALSEGRVPEYGLLGVLPQPLPDHLWRQGRRGAVVARVLPGTPAERGDLRADDVITHVDGHPVRNDEDLIRLVGLLPPGAEVRLTVERGDDTDETREAVVLLAKRYLATRRPAFGRPAGTPWRGLRVDYGTAVPNFEELAERIAKVGGVLIQEVEQDSAAWRAGVRQGDFITQVDGTTVSDPTSFERAVAGRPLAVALRVVDLQGHATVRTVVP